MNGAVAPVDTPPLESVGPVPVDQLVLDPRNPRLVTVNGETTNEKSSRSSTARKTLASCCSRSRPTATWISNHSSFWKRGVILSFSRGTGAWPPFACSGNRSSPPRVGKRGRLRITLPEFPNRYRSTLDRVSVYRVASREDALSFIGFKHINGAAKWESYAKGRNSRPIGIVAVRYCFRISRAESATSTTRSSAWSMRSTCLNKHNHAGIFRIDDRVSPRFNFSHLYTALSRAPYMQFLGLDAAWARYDPSPDPVPGERVDHLSEVLRWMYGSKEGSVEPVVQSQNPDIKRLGEVLASAEGLTILKATGSLSEAHASTQPADQKFSEALLRTRRELREASNSLRGFDGRDVSLVGIAEDICETAQTIQDRMRKKVREAEMSKE